MQTDIFVGLQQEVEGSHLMASVFPTQEVRVGYLLREGMWKNCGLQAAKVWRAPERSARGS